MTRKEKLRASWSKRERDIVYSWPGYKGDGTLLHSVLGADRLRFDLATLRNVYDRSFLKELEARGYDLTTLKFSIEKKAQT